jgi:hypothetical protein
VRVGLAGLVLVTLLAAPRLFDPRTWTLAQAVHDLGPISGWRCAESETYVYDPSHERPDSNLLAEAPEATILAQVPWLEVERVEANLRGGDTLVTVRGPEDQRVYVLAPGRLQKTTVCNAHLSNWHIVGEQEMG